MNIDWSKAPEDATHAISFEGVDHRFRKMVGGKWLSWVTESEKWYGVGGLLSGKYIERTKKQEAWGGEGLPPVNCFCETLDEDINCWVKVEIYAHAEFMGETHACAKNGTDMFYGLAHEFRPIKTADQLAEEERDKARTEVLNAMTSKTMGFETEDQWQQRMKVVGEMLDMGYRKQ